MAKWEMCKAGGRTESKGIKKQWTANICKKTADLWLSNFLYWARWFISKKSMGRCQTALTLQWPTPVPIASRSITETGHSRDVPYSFVNIKDGNIESGECTANSNL